MRKYLKGFRVICILKFTKGHTYVTTVGRVTLPFSVHHLLMLYICIKFQENISKDFRVIEPTCLHRESYKGAKFHEKVQVELWYLFCAHCCLIMFYIWAKFCSSISKDFWVTDSNSRVSTRVVPIYKGANSIKTVDGVMVLNLYKLSDDALYLYQVTRKYLKGFRCHLPTEIYKGA